MMRHGIRLGIGIAVTATLLCCAQQANSFFAFRTPSTQRHYNQRMDGVVAGLRMFLLDFNGALFLGRFCDGSPREVGTQLVRCCVEMPLWTELDPPRVTKIEVFIFTTWDDLGRGINPVLRHGEDVPAGKTNTREWDPIFGGTCRKYAI